MGRIDLELLSKAKLIELVFRLQHPEKTSGTSSKPPSTDRKAQRDKSRPGRTRRSARGFMRWRPI
jgi:transposase